MKNLLFAPLALAALLLGSAAAAEAAPGPPHRFSAREQARWDARHRPAPRPLPARAYPAPRPAPAPPAAAYHYHRGEPLPTHRVTRLPLPPAGPHR